MHEVDARLRADQVGGRQRVRRPGGLLSAHAGDRGRVTQRSPRPEHS